MNAAQAMLVAVGFVAALFALVMGGGQIVEWWRARKDASGVQVGSPQQREGGSSDA